MFNNRGVSFRRMISLIWSVKISCERHLSPLAYHTVSPLSQPRLPGALQGDLRHGLPRSQPWPMTCAAEADGTSGPWHRHAGLVLLWASSFYLWAWGEHHQAPSGSREDSIKSCKKQVLWKHPYWLLTLFSGKESWPCRAAVNPDAPTCRCPTESQLRSERKKWL